MFYELLNNIFLILKVLSYWNLNFELTTLWKSNKLTLSIIILEFKCIS